MTSATGLGQLGRQQIHQHRALLLKLRIVRGSGESGDGQADGFAGWLVCCLCRNQSQAKYEEGERERSLNWADDCHFFRLDTIALNRDKQPADSPSLEFSKPLASQG